MTDSMQPCVHYTTSNEETFLQYFFYQFALELLANLEEMFLLYYMHGDIFSLLESSTTYEYVNPSKRVNERFDLECCVLISVDI